MTGEISACFNLGERHMSFSFHMLLCGNIYILYKKQPFILQDCQGNYRNILDLTRLTVACILLVRKLNIVSTEKKLITLGSTLIIIVYALSGISASRINCSNSAR